MIGHAYSSPFARRYSNVPDYAGRKRERAVLNVNDNVVVDADPGRLAFCAVKEERERYVASLTLGIDRNVNPSAIARNGAMAGPPPGPPPAGMREGGPPPFQPIKDRLAALVPGVKRSK